MNTLASHSLDDLHLVADKLIKLANKHRVIAFTGNLGAGKTTLIREILAKLSISDFLGSPTFSLVNEYTNKNGETLFHFDFYRIKNEEEALDIGYNEYLEKKDTWVFIEWPERIENLLPEHFLLVNIQHDKMGRTFKWKMF